MSESTGSESVCHGNNYYCIAIRRVSRVVARVPLGSLKKEKNKKKESNHGNSDREIVAFYLFIFYSLRFIFGSF